jgi:hypothetical protein
MDIAFAILAGLLVLAGLVGSILPFLPGPPLGWLGLLTIHFTVYETYSTTFLAVTFGVMVVITLLDYLIPIWGTKKFGGSRAGVWGSTIGLVVGLFFGPVGIIAGPFVGAFLGEFIVNRSEYRVAMRSAAGAFVGFLLGTGLKLAYCGMAIYYFVKALF